MWANVQCIQASGSRKCSVSNSFHSSQDIWHQENQCQSGEDTKMKNPHMLVVDRWTGTVISEISI